MRKPKTVSVVIPTYNRAHLVGDAIKSVLAQDIKDCGIEILVVDDGSTDDTAEVVGRFGDRVRYIRQENQGAGRARNRGIQEAKGEWIAFLDSDDRWLPYKLDLQFRVLDALPGYKAVHSDFYTFDETGITIKKGLYYWFTAFAHSEASWPEVYSGRYSSAELNIRHGGKSFDIYTGNIFRALLKAPVASCWTLLVRRDCLTPEVRFAEDYPTWEDYWFFCRLAERNDIIFMDIATAENRSHSGPRLTQIEYIAPLKCHIDTCKKVYFPSKSVNRPTDEEIESRYRSLHMILFKELLKRGRCPEARKILEDIKKLGMRGGGKSFWIYRASLLLPVNPVYYMVMMKRLLRRFKGQTAHALHQPSPPIDG